MSLCRPSSRRDVGCHLWDPSRCFSLRFPQGGVRRPRRTHWPFKVPLSAQQPPGRRLPPVGPHPVFSSVFPSRWRSTSSANALAFQSPSIGPAAAGTSAATCGTPLGVFLCVFLKVAFDVLGERIGLSKSLLSAQQQPGLVLRSEGPLLRRVVTSAATCGTPLGVFLCVFLKVAFDVPGERIGLSRSLYQPRSRRDVGCHLCFALIKCRRTHWLIRPFRVENLPMSIPPLGLFQNDWPQQQPDVHWEMI